MSLPPRDPYHLQQLTRDWGAGVGEPEPRQVLPWRVAIGLMLAIAVVGGLACASV
jgi:hypothetical protein